jgi:hypothetical protein
MNPNSDVVTIGIINRIDIINFVCFLLSIDSFSVDLLFKKRIKTGKENINGILGPIEPLAKKYIP